MALPDSGEISIGMIATEFGGAAPHSLSEYYRGGTLVPDTAQNANIPTSGRISLSDFYGSGVGVPPAPMITYRFEGSATGGFIGESSVSEDSNTGREGEWVRFRLDFNLVGEFEVSHEVVRLSAFTYIDNVITNPVQGLVDSLTVYQGTSPGGIEYPESGYTLSISGDAYRLTFTPPMDMLEAGGRTRLVWVGQVLMPV